MYGWDGRVVRIVVVSSWLPWPLDNGSRVRAYHLLRELSRRHTLTLLTFGTVQDASDLAPLDALCERVELIERVVPPAGRLGSRGLLSTVPRHLVQTESKQMRVFVREAVGRHDLALALQLDAARYLDGECRLPCVFEEAEVSVLREAYSREQRPLQRLRRGLTWLKHRSFVRSLANRFDRVTVVSEVERRHLEAMGCDATRIAIVPNGVEIPAIPPSLVRTARLVYPGPVTYFANLDAVQYFIEDIFPLVRRSRPGLTFWVTGLAEGVELGRLRAAEGVTFTGRLPQVETFVAESAVCVVPLRIGGGTRLKVLQAMAVGTPVVSTSKGIEGLDVEPERHVLVADTPDAFARQVLRVLDDSLLAARLAEASRRLVEERYTWGLIGEALERVIAAAVREHRSRRDPIARKTRQV
jgi:glycosyltransferase involved in cell wall biosynthesis